MGWVLAPKPPDLVDLFFNFQALQVVKLRLVALERAVQVVLAFALANALALKRNIEFALLIRNFSCSRDNKADTNPGFPLKDDHSAAFIPSCNEIAIVVELDAGNYIRCK